MDNSQLDQIIKDSLAKTNGDKQAAVKLLAELSVRDDQLLQLLVKPFLGSILLHRVDQVAKQLIATQKLNSLNPLRKNAATAKEEAEQTAMAGKAQEAPAEMIDQLVSVLGNAIPVGLPRRPNDSDPVNQLGIGPGDIPPPPAGERHQRAIQAVALGFKYKGK